MILDLWHTIIFLLGLQRAQALIKASFQDTNQGFTLPLQTCLKAAQQAPPAAPGGYYAPQWPEQGGLGFAPQLGSISRHTGAGSRNYRMRKRARLGQVSSSCSSIAHCTQALLYLHLSLGMLLADLPC